MKSLLISLTAIAAITAAPVLAADMPPSPPRMPVEAPPPAAYNWTGLYSVSSLGGEWWNVTSDYLATPTDHLNTKATRAFYGSSYGAQYQWGNVVLGIEGTVFTLFDSDYTTSLSPSGDCLASTANITCSSRVEHLWTAGGRIGWAADRVLIFGGGGYASGRIQTETTLTTAAGGSPAGTATGYTSARNGGWYGGGGLEFFVGKFWWSDVILGAEYQHIELDSKTHADLVAPGGNRNVGAEIDVARARLVLKMTP